MAGKKKITVHENSGKAGLLNGIIWNKFDPHFVATWFDILWDIVATIDTDKRTSGLVSVTDFQEIVDAVIVVFNFKGLKFECHLIIGGDGDFPSALLVGLIVVGEVGRLEMAAIHVQIPTTQRYKRMSPFPLWSLHYLPSNETH